MKILMSMMVFSFRYNSMWTRPVGENTYYDVAQIMQSQNACKLFTYN